MSWSLLDKAYKILVNKRATSTLKKPYEEFGDNTLDVHASEVKAQPIPFNDPAQGIVDGVVELQTLLVLTEDVTVANYQSWYAFSGVRLKNWISDKYGALYTAKLYDNNNVQIFPTDVSDWNFDYVTGILNFNGDVSAYARPFKLTGYRYIGDYMDSISGGARLKKQIIPITSNGQTSFDLSVELPEPFDEIFQVKVNGVPLRSVEWSVSVNTLSFSDIIAQFTLATTDEFEVHYYSA